MTTKSYSLSLADSRVLSYAITSSSSSKNDTSSNPYILLSNSLCTPYPLWDNVVPRLTDLGFNVLRYDQPGHGASTAPPKDLSSTTFDSMAADVHALLQHLDIRELHAWIGVSMGAATAVVFAAKYPGIVGKLVVCDTILSSPVNAGSADIFTSRVEAAREAGNLDATIEETLGRWFSRDWLDGNLEERERMRGVMRGTTVDGFETCCAALRSETFDLRRVMKMAGEGVGEALLIVGGNDANLPEVMEELRKGIESGLKGKGRDGVLMKVVDNAGHVPFVDGFEQFMEHVTPFLV
ncbi:alpha/beta-hydrolase [Poronia punctata]|nr:alpha/beta-hydrolase [Poronia punctata]